MLLSGTLVQTFLTHLDTTYIHSINLHNICDAIIINKIIMSKNYFFHSENEMKVNDEKLGFSRTFIESKLMQIIIKIFKNKV